ncbi:MAG: TIGR00282 family metallophosphoesterase [Candidatus Spechtbacterales bacterium]
MPLTILFFGDIFGRPGREAVGKILPELREQYHPDFIVANVENLAHGRGITRATMEELERMGAFHAYTGGNHIWDKAEATELFTSGSMPLVRPLNYARDVPGTGARVVANGAQRMVVINALGRVFMKGTEELTEPFSAIDAVLERYTLDKNDDEREYVNAILVDLHAEATSEKRAMGFYLDGRISMFVGTHTHVPTRDEQILPKGTAYLTDVGMVGPLNSSIGLEVEGIIEQFLENTLTPPKKEVSEYPEVEVGAVVVRVGETGLAESIEPIRKIVDIG